MSFTLYLLLVISFIFYFFWGHKKILLWYQDAWYYSSSWCTCMLSRLKMTAYLVRNKLKTISLWEYSCGCCLQRKELYHSQTVMVWELSWVSRKSYHVRNCISDNHSGKTYSTHITNKSKFWAGGMRWGQVKEQQDWEEQQWWDLVKTNTVSNGKELHWWNMIQGRRFE